MASQEQEDTPVVVVAVTGASGFVGSHVARLLVERGYTVRALVRDPSDKEKVGHLIAMQQQSNEGGGGGGRLELCAADLTVPGSCDEAIRGCRFLFHTAATVVLNVSDPQRQIVDSGVAMTQNVLNAAAKAKDTLKRMVVTSSMSAVHTHGRQYSAPVDESCWNETNNVAIDAYGLQKVTCERLANKFVEDMPFDVVHICPGWIFGPVLQKSHIRTSPALVYMLMARQYPLIPQFHFNVVDVRDVALAHLAAAETENASGRYILSSQVSSAYTEIAAWLREKYPMYNVPKGVFWNWFMYVVAVFDGRVNRHFLDEQFATPKENNNQRSREQLGIVYRDAKESVLATAESLIAVGAVPNLLSSSSSNSK